jgi:hypothetical protein
MIPKMATSTLTTILGLEFRLESQSAIGVRFQLSSIR